MIVLMQQQTRGKKRIFPRGHLNLKANSIKTVNTLRGSFLLYLVWELVFHILLDAAQHERLKNHVQSGKLVWNTKNKSSATRPDTCCYVMFIVCTQMIEFPTKKFILTLIDGRLVLSVALDVLGEPLVKLFVGIEQCGHDEVQQGPQLRDGNNTRSSTTRSSSHRHIAVRTHSGSLTSAIVFWMGVPVSSSLFRHWNCRRIFHRTLENTARKQRL